MKLVREFLNKSISELNIVFAPFKLSKINIERMMAFEVKKDEKYIICEDIITTGGSALEVAKQIQNNGGKIVAFAALANRGFCQRFGSNTKISKKCELPKNIKLFALDDFIFEMYESENCPLCKNGSIAYKPGSRGN